MVPGAEDEETLQAKVERLERQLHDANLRLKQATTPRIPAKRAPLISSAETLHSLLLLTDSALPLGSFAFSNGLESFLAHRRLPSSSGPLSSISPLDTFQCFLSHSLTSLRTLTLPFLLAAHAHPSRLVALDDVLDASTPCHVARRASVAQGRALLAAWERSFRPALFPTFSPPSSSSSSTAVGEDDDDALTVLHIFAASLRRVSPTSASSSYRDVATNPVSAPFGAEPLPSAHLAPLWGVLTRAVGLPASVAAYAFCFSHARALAGAAVRAGLFGPYQAQGVLTGEGLRGWVGGLVEEAEAIDEGDDGGRLEGLVEEAGQSVPVLDLWMGRHELLYSRVFNS